MPEKSPFHSYDIKRGQTRGATNWLSFRKSKKDESGADSSEKIVGQFKGIVTVESEEFNKEF